jgi:DNA-binding XRE family transcriptional regulator
VVFDTASATISVKRMTGRVANFSDRLKAARLGVRSRTGQKMTQQELASLVGVERNTVSRWENSGVNPKDPMVIGKLADVLAVSTDWLVRGGQSSEPPVLPYTWSSHPPSADTSGHLPAPGSAGGATGVERRLPVRAYEQIDGYLARLESAGCSPAQIREAERVLRDGAYNRLRGSDLRTRETGEMLEDIESAWRFIVAVLAREGVALE